jgi:hypothetical protein
MEVRQRLARERERKERETPFLNEKLRRKRRFE